MSLYIELSPIDKLGKRGTPSVMATCDEFPAVVAVGIGIRAALLKWCDEYERYQLTLVGDDDS